MIAINIEGNDTMPSHTTSIHLKKMSERTPTNTNPETRAVLSVCVCLCALVCVTGWSV